MEVQKVGPSSIKIKTKNVSFVTNTLNSGDSVPLFFTPPADSKDVFFIEGPGEYEIAGVRVKGTREGDGVLYEIMDDPITLFLANTKALKSLKSLDEGTIIVVENNGEVTKDELTTLDAYLTILYGEKIAGESFPEIEKVNLRKLEEIKGIVALK